MITLYPNLLKGDIMSRKYRVEQKFTTGWGVVDESCLLYTSPSPRDNR